MRSRPNPAERATHFASLASCPAFVVLGLASFAKLTDLPSFALSLETWEWIPVWSIPALSTIVPTLEALVVVGWVLSARRAMFEWFALGLVMCFTVVYAGHALLAKPPDCQCLGRLSAFFATKDSATVVVARNSAMMVMLGLALALRHGRRRACALRRADHSTQRVSMGAATETVRSGFSLLEVLLCIAIIAILLALSTPLLSDARDAARRTGSMSNLREHGSIFLAYTSDYGEQFPFFTDPKATVTVLRHSGYEIAIPYFTIHAFWNFGMADYGYDGQLVHRSMSPPGRERSVVMESYLYACSLIAAPEFWNATTRTGPDQWRSTRVSAVLFPSHKGLMIDRSEEFALDEMIVDTRDDPRDPLPEVPASLRTRVRCPTVFIDGHVRSVKRTEFLRSYFRGDGHWTGSGIHNGPDPVLHTIDGVRGRDIP